MSDPREKPRDPLSIVDQEARRDAAVPACFSSTTRREAVKQIGGWLIFAGALGSIEGCGQPANNTKTSATCDCGVTTGANTGLKKTDIPLNGVAYHSSQGIFLCHDSAGFYAMSSVCTHQGCDMGTTGGGFQSTNLGAGFFCNCHGSRFDVNGNATAGPAGSPLAHFQLGVDASGAIFVDTGTVLSDPTCRCT